MKTIVITGALGFIGSHLSEYFLQNGYYVVGLDNYSGRYPISFYEYNRTLLCSYSHFVFKGGNILDKREIDALLGKFCPHILIHCAGRANVLESIKNPEEYMRVNIEGTQNILEAIHNYSPQTKVILFSSSSVYGNAKSFLEVGTTKPISPYGVSKLKMEKLGKKYSSQHKLRVVVVRPFSIFGPRGRLDMLPLILLKNASLHKVIVQRGENNTNRRDWTYISVLVQCIDKIVKKYDFNKFEIFNIANGESVGIEEFVKEFISQYTAKFSEKCTIEKKKKYDIEMNLVNADISKMKDFFTQYPHMSYKKGIRNLLFDYKENEQHYRSLFRENDKS